MSSLQKYNRNIGGGIGDWDCVIIVIIYELFDVAVDVAEILFDNCRYFLS